MDKSWMQKPRNTEAYYDGAREFIKLADSRGAVYDGRLKCPCIKCCNVYYQDVKTTYDHIIWHGIGKSYTTWFFHGENNTSSSFTRDEMLDDVVEEDDDTTDDMRGMLHDLCGLPSEEEIHDSPRRGTEGTLDDNAARFFKLADDAEVALYTGCKHTKLSFIVRLWHIKCLCGWSNKSFSMLLELLREVLPEGSKIPDNFTQSKKIVTDLGLSYNKIDACPNNCMLYYKESSDKQKCDICGTSRWKMHENYNPDDTKKKTPAKILRYFPLKPRLQRLYMSSRTATDMVWHDVERVKDGVLRHPADSRAWMHLDQLYPTFKEDPRNVRLGLATDGFNPFRTMTVTHSTWPVVLFPYNLPPWLCMKQPSIILSTIIPGPKSPGNNIDVYLRPLIDELKDLWLDGVETYDALKKEMFILRAALLWTISDFPGYAMLSGWSTKGKKACPSCHKNTCSQRLKHGKKECYMGHRRFLPMDHKFRSQTKTFNGKPENEVAPKPMSGTEVLNEVNKFEHKPIIGEEHNWRKKSIFFELPYWEHNLLRHNLDVMHIEKNICDNVLFTLLGIDGKSKDGINARKDLVEMGLRKELHPQQIASNKYKLPASIYNLDRHGKEQFCRVLKNMKIPDGFSSNISSRVNVKERKISGLKSHDSHTILQHFLPMCIRHILPKYVARTLIDLSTFFRELCSRVCRTDDLIHLEKNIALTLCHLERIFPPAFFDIMVHLPIHLASDALLGGPVHYRWMYPIERYLFTLKSYVRNKAQPEGSIAEAYLADECLTFCSRYLHNVESRLNRPKRSDEETLMRSAKVFNLTDLEWTQAHRYVLYNNVNVTRYIEDHKRVIRHKFYRKRPRPHDIEKEHERHFIYWIKDRIRDETKIGFTLPKELQLLAEGPHHIAERLECYPINGYNFRTVAKESKAKTQNSGVYLSAATTSFSSARDINPIIGNVEYFGRLIDIIQLTYSDELKVTMFKCEWVDVRVEGRGIKKDDLGNTLVNFTRLAFSDEPYVLASQVKQVFYVDDPIDPNWKVVFKVKPKVAYELRIEDRELLTSDQNLNDRGDVNDDGDDDTEWVRTDVEGEIVVVTGLHNDDEQ